MRGDSTKGQAGKSAEFEMGVAGGTRLSLGFSAKSAHLRGHVPRRRGIIIASVALLRL